MKHLLAWSILLLAPSVLLTAQVSIEEASLKAQTMNLEIIKAQREVRDAAKELKGELYLKNSKFSIGGGYLYASPAALAENPSLLGRDGFSGSLGVTLPFVPQAALSGEVEVQNDGEFKETISLKLQPFLKKDPLYPQEEQYGKALVRLKYLLQKVYYDAEQAALNIILREHERDQAQDTLSLEEAKYEVVRQQLETGTASFSDVQTQLVTLNEAQESLFTTELQLLKDRRDLALLFAPENEETGIKSIHLEELQERILVRTEKLSRLGYSVPSSEKLEILTLELKALQAELKATPRWLPSTEASATAGLPEFTFSITLDFSFSPGELKNDERENLESDIFEKQLDINAEVFGIELQKKLLEQSIDISRQALTSALFQLDKDTTSLRETELLFQQGRRTSLDLEQVKLNVRRSEIQSLKAAAGVYKAQADFLMLFLD